VQCLKPSTLRSGGEAAILSRMRSEVTSLSNWAKDQPKAVGQQQVVQCAVKAAEEDADVNTIRLIR